MLGKGHDKGVDYWALGILLFEQVAGYSPFSDSAKNDQIVICRNILRGVVEFPAHVRDKDVRAQEQWWRWRRSDSHTRPALT